MSNYDWIIALSIILFPIGLAIGLLLRHRRQFHQASQHQASQHQASQHQQK